MRTKEQEAARIADLRAITSSFMNHAREIGRALEAPEDLNRDDLLRIISRFGAKPTRKEWEAVGIKPGAEYCYRPGREARVIEFAGRVGCELERLGRSASRQERWKLTMPDGRVRFYFTIHDVRGVLTALREERGI